MDRNLSKSDIKSKKQLNIIIAESSRLGRLINNVLSNVEKYAASGKQVEVVSEFIGDKLFLTVKDNGLGIPAVLKDKIFEPFFRVSNKLTDGVSGTEIGLSLVRTLAELHRGTVVLLSDTPSDPGDGAVFQVKLTIMERQT